MAERRKEKREAKKSEVNKLNAERKSLMMSKLKHSK